MVFCGHSNTGFNNENGSKSRAGAHVFLSVGDDFPRWNGLALLIAQIMKYTLSSTAEANTAALFPPAEEMVSLRNTLDTMGWKQPAPPCSVVILQQWATLTKPSFPKIKTVGFEVALVHQESNFRV